MREQIKLSPISYQLISNLEIQGLSSQIPNPKYFMLTADCRQLTAES